MKTAEFASSLLLLVVLTLTIPAFFVLFSWIAGALLWMIAGGAMSPAIVMMTGVEMDFRLFASFFAVISFAMLSVAAMIGGAKR